MKKEDKYSEFETKARTGELPDELNPILLFNLTCTKLLIQILIGEIDPVELANRELRNRGLDNKGMWEGLKRVPL
ncbi:hypothetical protein [Flavisolibacter ginsengisoli]|jgi:hypothetical protein|uniref:Uncharacterized protein n=1 Tax=Flavisolibacter ginsengisoli DSM 18119 TaxID=1121884 RepID=A0A1M5CFP9_9BACT|nr:hypothetical protein [Flavisolibacter ginsengisoli]SHF53520.1 hypothetical protein SAMN02745131_02921 [Flavisolibacter ginsengisoli DSM 18119]